jgi:hypothetical protein
VLGVVFAGLQKDAADNKKLLEGAHKLKQVAASVYARQELGEGSRQLCVYSLVLWIVIS